MSACVSAVLLASFFGSANPWHNRTYVGVGEAPHSDMAHNPAAPWTVPSYACDREEPIPHHFGLNGFVISAGRCGIPVFVKSAYPWAREGPWGRVLPACCQNQHIDACEMWRAKSSVVLRHSNRPSAVLSRSLPKSALGKRPLHSSISEFGCWKAFIGTCVIAGLDPTDPSTMNAFLDERRM